MTYSWQVKYSSSLSVHCLNIGLIIFPVFSLELTSRYFREFFWLLVPLWKAHNDTLHLFWNFFSSGPWISSVLRQKKGKEHSESCSVGHTKHFSRPEYWKLRDDDNNVCYFLKHLNIHWFSWVLPFFSFSTQNSFLLSLFSFFVLPVVTRMYWNFLWLLSRNNVSTCLSLYPRLSHLSLLHLIIWTYFYFMYWFFSSFRLLNNSWILVLFLLKDYFFFDLCFYYHSIVTGKISLHPTLSLSPSYPSQQICLESCVLKIGALPLLPN